MTDVMVPTLGESVTEATVSTWFKKVGDAVAVDEMLCELETDKVSVEVPSPVAGVLTEILAPEGTTVDAKARLAVVAEGAAAAATAGAAATAAPAAAAAPAPAARADVEDAPAAKKAMAEAGLSATEVTGTGKDGRIMKEDVARAVAGKAEAAPAVASAVPAPAAPPRAPAPAEDAAREERVKMTRLRATIARRLKDAQNTAAMLTTYNEVDMSGVMELRNAYKDQFEKKHGVKLGFMSFFVKACCHALKEVPEVNAEIDGGDIVYKNYVHMGVAVGTPTGLVVPVVRDADQMSFAARSRRRSPNWASAPATRKLSMAEMQGGSFTISNSGVRIADVFADPVPPQSGILGMHEIQDRPVGRRPDRHPPMMLLSYDHRIVDGKGAVTVPRARQGRAGRPAPAPDGSVTGKVFPIRQIACRMGKPPCPAGFTFRRFDHVQRTMLPSTA